MQKKRFFGFNHADIGKWLADKWKLPEVVQSTICYHHSPMEAPQYQNEVGLIHLADYLTASYLLKVSEGDSDFPLDHGVLELFHVSEERIETIKDQMIDEGII